MSAPHAAHSTTVQQFEIMAPAELDPPFEQHRFQAFLDSLLGVETDH